MRIKIGCLTPIRPNFVKDCNGIILPIDLILVRADEALQKALARYPGSFGSTRPFGLFLQVVEHFAGFANEKDTFGFAIRVVFDVDGFGIAVA
jgi:hypothetical protein